MMGNITINIWMILTVILFVGMIAILVSSIYRGIKGCHKRIDEQKNNFEKTEQCIENINNEITNIKIEQATLKAVQGFDIEGRKKEITASPIHIYQHPANSSSTCLAVQSVPQPQPQVQPQSQPKGDYQAPKEAELCEEPQHIQQQVSQPSQVAEKQSVEQQTPKAIQKEEAKPLQQIEEQAVEIQEPPQNPVQGEAPIYHQTRIPAIGFTEFQLPEECDVEDEVNYPQDWEIENQPLPQAAAKNRIEAKSRPRPQAEPALIPEKENINPSKFNSLNDGISRTGKRYSEEELSYKILD